MGASGSPHSPRTAPPDGPFVLAMVLAALAGWVDAAGLSGSAALFVSFMSGDTTQGAIAAAQMDWPRLGQIGAVIGSFVAGIIGGELLGMLFARHGTAVVLLLEAGCLALAAWLAELPSPFPPWSHSCLLAVAMGLQNATMHRTAGMNVGLTYVTGTLVQFGRSIAAGLGGAPVWGRAARYGGLWLSLAAGACASALVLPMSRLATLAAAACLALVLSAVCGFLQLRTR